MWTFIIYFLIPLLGTVSIFWIAAYFLPFHFFITNFFLPFLGILMGLSIAGAIYGTRRSKLVSSLLPNELRSREQQIRHLADRIRTGQSSAIIGFFSEERRTILGYLRNENPKQQEELYGDKANQLIFSYIDIAFLDKECSPSQFWEMALEPLRIKITDSEQLDKAYQACQDNQFNKRSLENLISLVNQKGWRLVLLLDKFEELLQHPHFKKNWEFFTTLRALAALRTPSPLALVIASHSSLEEFHKKIKHLSPSASPVLNFIGETAVLGSLSEAEIDNLLDQNDLPLSQTNRKLIKDMAGGHPYLLQNALLALHEVSLQGKELLEQSVKEAFSLRIENVVLEDDIKFWPPRTCHAFFTVLQQRDISGFENELKKLETHGLIAKVNGEWQIRAQIFLKLLANQNKQLCKEKQMLES
jgi:hypothetical protein